MKIIIECDTADELQLAERYRLQIFKLTEDAFPVLVDAPVTPVELLLARREALGNRSDP